MTENERKNLFTYATKELSQDAFLMWLFNNYDDEDLKSVVYSLLNKFCKHNADDKIISMRTEAQWHDIDISVWFETSGGKKYALFIEDKVDSGEHYQLEKYNGYINSDVKSDYEVCKVYYKPGYLYPDEIDRVNKAKWNYLTCDEIYELFQPFADSPNSIVRMYIEHISARIAALSVTAKPKKSDTAIDLLEWLSFFSKTVIKRLENEFDKTVVQFSTWRAGQYPYICLVARYGGDEHVPYLEIRSRECTETNFKARILCYGMKGEYVEQQEKLIERIKASELFECKNLHYNKKGEKIFPKQIGYTKKDALQTNNDEEFIEAVKVSVREYLNLMREWDN